MKSRLAKRTVNRSKSEKGSTYDKIRPVLFGCLAGLIFTVAAILIFALIIKMFQVSDNAISIVNQVIKVLGIAIASWVTLRSRIKPIC
jgi:hypothetical protein